MPTLDFKDSMAKAPSTKRPLKLFLGTGVLVGALALGSTFAANINLNGNSDVGRYLHVAVLVPDEDTVS